MDPEQQALSELDRANRAKNLLEDELLRSAFDDLRATWRKEWEDTPPDATERRETLYAGLHVLNRVERALGNHVLTGRYAADALEKIRSGP